jgi:large subunit ribosomal protein L16
MGGEDITEKTAKEAMRLAQYKLPVKTKFISIDKNQEVTSQEKKNISKKSKEEVKQ